MFVLFRRFIVNHFSVVCSSHLDVIQHDTTRERCGQNDSSHRPHFWFIFVYIVLMTIYSVIGLHLEAGLPLDLPHLATSPYIVMHQVYPRAVWPQIDILFPVSTIGVAIIVMLFAHDPPLDWRYALVEGKGTDKLKMGNNGK